ncbi:MAG TPA: urea transporter [Bacteroidales bacterium]|nr:urea transporter [Bacteroidales bacterium]
MNRRKLIAEIPEFLEGITHSYTQVFFSNHPVFALILIVVSFFDLSAGVSGVTAVAVSNLFALLMGLNRDSIKKGHYGFNSLLVGLGLGLSYQLTPEFFIVLIFSSLLTLILTLWFQGVFGKYGLPFLSISFLFALWLVTLAARDFTALQLSENDLYLTNDLFSIGGEGMVKTSEWMSALAIPEPLQIYFTSLGAIIFQYHLFAGILVALGLLIFSRIAFVLSLVGFFTAYFYYRITGTSLRELGYSYIGFNYILTAIAVGGYFIIPSRWSFLGVILLTPFISIILISTSKIFGLLQLSVFSLPFNTVVILFLYALKFRERHVDRPELVIYQQGSPEQNLYAQENSRVRFGNSLYLPFILPFWGEWTVTQGYDGAFTHQGEWRHAWDFEVADDEGTRYSGSGSRVEDFYAYNRPVTAPAYGWVEEVVDHIGDNPVGSLNIENNWGNTIILRHTDHLYSKLCHLKQGSIKVHPGETVIRGQVLASCGNSGRSAVPHLHFQIQSTPYIGSKTLEYPISHYIEHRKGAYELFSYSKPANGTILSNIEKNASLEQAFHFIPGRKITLEATASDGSVTKHTWEVRIDALNYTSLYCEATHSEAWFRNDGEIHYFTHFSGDRNSLLFRFYLAAYKVMLGYYPGLLVRDAFPANTFGGRIAGVLQDFVAPFHLFSRSEYHLRYLAMDDALMQSDISLRATVSVFLGRREVKKITCDLFIGPSGMKRFVLHEKETVTEVTLKHEP